MNHINEESSKTLRDCFIINLKENSNLSHIYDELYFVTLYKMSRMDLSYRIFQISVYNSVPTE